MPNTGGEGEMEPLMRPHLIRFLRDRPKMIGGGLREEVLDNLDIVITERRKPNTVAERAVSKVMGEAKQVSEPVAKNRVQKKLEKENEKRLKRI